MQFQDALTDDAVLAELGKRLAGIRLNRNQTQSQLADNAGVGKRTVERLENGESVQLGSFVRVCRELGLIRRLDSLVPEPVPSPLAQVKLMGKTRRRASHKKSERPSKPWTWGDSE